MFDCADDPEAAGALFDRVFAWGKQRGLGPAVGPRGLCALDGYGVLVDGFDRRQLMTMTGYNGPWYRRLLEGLGFQKEVDFVSYELTRSTFVMPDAVTRAAARATASIRIVRYSNKRALVRAASRIGDTYNRAFAANWEYYPLTDREIAFVVDQVYPLVDRRLMAFVAAGQEIIGFVLAFPDISAALQRAAGRLTPWSLARLLVERGRASSVALNGAGVLPDNQVGARMRCCTRKSRTPSGTVASIARSCRKSPKRPRGCDGISNGWGPCPSRRTASTAATWAECPARIHSAGAGVVVLSVVRVRSCG